MVVELQQKTLDSLSNFTQKTAEINKNSNIIIETLSNMNRNTSINIPRNDNKEGIDKRQSSKTANIWQVLRTLKNAQNYNYLLKQKQKDKFSMFNVITYKSNMRQYICQCFSLLLVNDLKLIFFPLPSLQLKRPSDVPEFFFPCFSLLFVKDLKLDLRSLAEKASYTPVLT